MTCRCGHRRRFHVVPGGCSAPTRFDYGGSAIGFCRCPAFDDSCLPAKGERPVFGVHRLHAEEAEAAPAWPSVAVVAGRIRGRTTRALRRLA